MTCCASCGHQTLAEAQTCGLCGEKLLTRQDTGGQPRVYTSPATRPAYSTPNRLALAQARSRRFLLVLAALLAVPLGLFAAGWGRREALLGRLENRQTLAMALAVTLAYGSLLHGYLLRITAEAGELSGRPGLLMAFFPPLIPAAWARLGQRPLLRPYLWLTLELVLLGGGGWLLRAYPCLVLLLLLSLLPPFMYHLHGGALAPLARRLGVSPLGTLCWVCLGPDLLLGLLTLEVQGALDAADARTPLALSFTEISNYLNTQFMMSYDTFKIALFLYLLLSLTAWIKTLYDNLNYPA